MRTTLALAAAALAATVAVPASASTAVQLTCVSLDTRCQSFSCPAGTTTVFDNGFTDTGPWVVICRPTKV